MSQAEFDALPSWTKRGGEQFLLRFGLGFAAVGLVLLAIGGVLTARQVTFLRTAVKANGTIIDIVTTRSTSRDSNGRTHDTVSRFPVVAFQARNEQHVEFKSSSSKSDATIGQAVGVRYDPKHPTDASLDGVASLWLLEIILGGLGAMFLFFGGVALYLQRLEQREAVR